ncbi:MULTISPECIES: hypothetical protein [Rhizobium]|uniref:hypothetical protein n=1 Tax=Rhizobium TaxID=379 RepID=UPI00139184ED|nr:MULTISPECIES: hypothetical protein [Rhizobium]MCA0804439.1 hypothetical protein [Rhizobium sp. T1473]MCS0460767.1 hypothetical protein [Rhizobium favelukesii]UFS80630.1 hypothetical protein LPB79_02575 [Rhizobium sp. T136]
MPWLVFVDRPALGLVAGEVVDEVAPLAARSATLPVGMKYLQRSDRFGVAWQIRGFVALPFVAILARDNMAIKGNFIDISA